MDVEITRPVYTLTIWADGPEWYQKAGWKKYGE